MIILTGWMNPMKLTMRANIMKKCENFLLPLI